MNDLKTSGGGDARAYNLGLGRGTSILELIEATSRVTGTNFEVRQGPQLPEDSRQPTATPPKSNATLGWKPSDHPPPTTSSPKRINWMVKKHP
ncbi:MAG: hypothetical protein R3B46_01315 [Phycisphaerales bacterium]